jgi:hypothetical protein
VNVNAIEPLTVPAGGAPEDETLIERSADPVPEEGLIWSHGWLGVAVHVTVPGPFCLSRTVCAAV